MISELHEGKRILSFNRVLWAVPVVFFLHEMEEWNVLSWELSHFEGFESVPLIGLRLWLLLASVFGFLLTWIATRFQSEKITAYIIFPAIILTVLNGAQHVTWTFYFRDISPGFFFGGLLGIPVGIYLLFRAIKEKLVHPLYAVPFIGYATYATAQTVFLGARTPPIIRVIHGIVRHLDLVIAS
jgi:hypothetical protein